MDDMSEAFEGADIVYPKSWGPFDLMLERRREPQRMKEIEAAALARNLEHKRWICDEKLMSQTRGGDALYMHCLPADIGAEVSAPVMERARLSVAREANKKLYVIMALLAVAKVRRLREALEKA